MRNLVILAAVALTGCASYPSPRTSPRLATDPPKTPTIAPHSQARKFKQQEDRRADHESAIKIEGGTVVR